MIGNAESRAAYAAAVAGGTPHHAWLIVGPEGVGKARFARQSALDWLAAGGDAAPHRRLIDAGSHPDYRELRRLPKDPDKPDQDIARSIPVGQVRAVLGMFATAASRRAVVIDTADDLERPGAGNALLKTLEEPPAGVIFFLVSHAPGRLLPTIRSRCSLLRFAPLTDDEVAQVLRHELPDLPDAEIAELVALAEGSPGRAMAMAGLNIAALDRTMAEIAADGDPTNARRAALAKALSGKNAQVAARYEAFLDRAAAFIARHATTASGEGLRNALDLHERARALAGSARGLSLDPQGTVFEMAGLVAALARR